MEAVDAIGVFVEPVVGPLVAHEEEDQRTKSQPHGQPDDVDEGVDLLLPKIAKGDFEVIPGRVYKPCQKGERVNGPMKAHRSRLFALMQQHEFPSWFLPPQE